jgi:hypothetical protein
MAKTHLETCRTLYRLQSRVAGILGLVQCLPSKHKTRSSNLSATKEEEKKKRAEGILSAQVKGRVHSHSWHIRGDVTIQSLISIL